MLFNSFSFLLFFPIVVLVYFFIPGKVRWVWLLASSLFFYMSWNVGYVFLLLTSILITWIGGLALERNRGQERKSKIVIAVCFFLNLLILALFKYASFLINTINGLLGFANIQIELPAWNILLPVGISFYTFQALSYIMDVYRGEVEAEHNLLKYALFVSFFPQLVAGPIERTGNLLKQINEVPFQVKPNYERITSGLLYMCYGYFVKMVIADRVAIVVDKIWQDYANFGGIELVLGVFLFAIQIYCDFMGYSTIAIGASQIMGFTLMENFEAPYLSRSIKEFWRRWHISLSAWFRDYVYFPMGGSRCSKLKKFRNIMIVFLLSGLWHGADWSYVVWGGLHGVYQIYEDLTDTIWKKVYPFIGVRIGTPFYTFLRVIRTFLLTSFAWIFFRANTIGDALEYIKYIFINWNPWIIWDGTLRTIMGVSDIEVMMFLVSMMFVLAVDAVRFRHHTRIDEYLKQQGGLAVAISVIFFLVVIFIFGNYGEGYNEANFIYFQF